MRRFLSLLALSGALAAPSFAQDRVDLDSDGRSRSRRASRQAAEAEVVREVERGVYVRAAVGSTIYLGNRGVGARRFTGGPAIVRAGTTLTLTVGGDVLDREKASVSVEGTFYQGLHNGLSFQDQGALGLTNNLLVQGDIHTFGLMIGAEGSYYPVRRFGIGGHIGGGIGIVPLLMNRLYYDEEVVGLGQGDGAWGGPANAPAVHNGVKPMIYVGPTFEYYTKLSHFSFGVDLDFLMVIGLDYGLVATGYFKYTF
jgi:hypothetical protein